MIKDPKHIIWPEETGDLICNDRVSNIGETGTIVSVFDKAINIRISNGLLVSLIKSPQAMTPLSICCSKGFSRFKDNAFQIKVGQTVNFGPRGLTINRVFIDITRAKRFSGLPDPLLELFATPPKVERFEKILNFAGQKGGLLGIFNPEQTDLMFVQKGALIAEKNLFQSASQRIECLSEFAGLGPGFTPSGDDLICGYLLGEKIVKVPLLYRFNGLDEKQKDSIWTAAAHTNDGGRTLIWMALQGRFPRFLLETAGQLACAESAKDILAIVAAASKHGHTSGTDTMVGLLLYLKIALVNYRHKCSRDDQFFSGRKQISFTG